MRNARFAEWVLGLVTAPERAASITGDLLEESNGRGACWFWLTVLWTAASHVWNDVRSAPGHMLWLAISGVVEFVILAFLLFTTVIRMWMDFWPYQIDANSFYIPPWGFHGIRIASFTVLPCLVAWDVARRSRGRELSAGVAFAVLMAALDLCFAMRSGATVVHYERPYAYVAYPIAELCASLLCIFAGSVLSRLMALRAGRQAPNPPVPAA